MKSILAILVFLISIMHALGQPNVEYSFYGNGDKEQLFFDDFDNPFDTLWVAGHNSGGYIKDGFYHHFSDTGGHVAADFHVILDSTKNYEIEFIAHVPKYNQSGIMFWGRNVEVGPGNYWYFYKNGNSVLKKCQDLIECRDTRIKGKAYSAYNKYTLRKIGDFYYFYVNERLRKTAPATPLYGSLFGLGGGTHRNRVAETVFADIRISYLKK